MNLIWKFDGYESHNTINKHSQDILSQKYLFNILRDNRMNNNATLHTLTDNLCITISEQSNSIMDY